ncbi:site-specific integrase [Embleya scabrispora]|uniref:site-specific integrase n=1 Tax=Embleya scabrispora TaxID=159449 RepID=UPI000D0FC528|nr:site-specific integrase [Embleya scabrispora]MYS81779.1 tyrosine-type recombinase/integrase [Streptomyces sp. SID5474]
MALRSRFPARPRESCWPRTEWDAEAVVTQVIADAAPTTWLSVRRGTCGILDWLVTQPGATWQERWLASGVENRPGEDWKPIAEPWMQGDGRSRRWIRKDLGAGMQRLICADVVRPDVRWMLSQSWPHLVRLMEPTRDPAGFARLRRQLAAFDARPRSFTGNVALQRIAVILAAKGGLVADVVPGECIELLDIQDTAHHGCGNNKLMHYHLLHAAGVFPPDAPASARAFRQSWGRMSCEELVDRYAVECTQIRDLFVDYLRERQPAVDYTTLQALSYVLVKLFWKDLETHHPGIDSLDVPREVAQAWKQRLTRKHRTVRTADGGTAVVSDERIHVNHNLTLVRAFYLDLAEWAAEAPGRWARWVAPSPVRAHEMRQRQQVERTQARMHQRTHHQLPLLPTIVALAERRRATSAALLAQATDTAPGERFTQDGTEFRRGAQLTGENRIIRIDEVETGIRRNLTKEEHEAFWAWAAIEVLRHTGIRIEELQELSHHSFVQYRLPTTGELVPLLQIAPSKTDCERLLLVTPELAEVLSTVIRRIRYAAGAVPMVVAYDPHERIWNPPMPLLFQYRYVAEHRQVTGHTLRGMINGVLVGAGLTGPSGEPLRLQPHDFRRMFVTDTVTNGMPPHIAQIICGHKDINTTMGYKAIYPQEAIEAHRAFITRRRATRPSEEYRVPTGAEWEDFLGHFERRKVSIGTCGRAFGTPCIHEHACVRCSMLRPDPAQRPRLAELRDNLAARIAEAEREGWLGEVEGLNVSLAGAEAKLAQINDSSVHLGMPDLSRIAGRTTTTIGVPRTDQEAGDRSNA